VISDFVMSDLRLPRTLQQQIPISQYLYISNPQTGGKNKHFWFPAKPFFILFWPNKNIATIGQSRLF
jgi:hypothetical protein